MLPITVRICTRGAVVSMDTFEECNFQFSNMNLTSSNEATCADISERKVQAACTCSTTDQSGTIHTVDLGMEMHIRESVGSLCRDGTNTTIVVDGSGATVAY